MKRTKHITINLTDEELEMLERIAEHNDRNKSEQARVLFLRQARIEWGQIQNQEHPQNLQPFKPIKFDS